MRTPEDAPTDADKLIRYGTIASVDLAAARCVVKLDTGAETAPLRWIETRMGATRTWSPPSVGEQVVLLCAGGEIGGGVVLRGLVSNAHPAPGDSLTELVEFSDGAVVSYDPVGHALAIILPDGATATLTAPGGTTINGDVTINGDTTLNGDAHATGTITGDTDVIADGISGKGHTHSEPQGGTGGAPD